MSHLKTNNIDLQSILDTINALPSAGGGGGETVGEFDASVSIYYPSMTEDGSLDYALKSTTGCYIINGGTARYFADQHTITVIDAVNTGDTLEIKLVGLYSPFIIEETNCTVTITTELEEFDGMEAEVSTVTVTNITGNVSFRINEGY